MGADDRTRARAAIDAVSDKHRALSATVAAAATWAAAVTSRTRQEADDVAFRRATADITGDPAAGAWGDELRDYQPLVVWPEYADRLIELHNDLGTALLGPAAYKGAAGLAPANALRTVKHTIEAAWRADRASRTFDGHLTEAPPIDQDIWLRRQEWVSEVGCAADVLEQTGFTSLWMRSTYSASVWDRLGRAERVFRDTYVALARSQFEPLVLREWKRRDVQLEKAVLESRGVGDQDGARAAITHPVALIIDDWIGALMVGGLSESECDMTVRILEDQFPDAVSVWRGICAARVANGHRALQVPRAFYTGHWERSAS